MRINESRCQQLITDERMKQILGDMNTIAVVGLSDNPARASHQVAKYMQNAGYRVIPVNPNADEILGEKVYSSLKDIEEPVDIVNVFRRSETVLPIAQEATQIHAKVFWLQLGIENNEAADLASQHGIEVIMNRCIKIEHARLLK